MSTCCPSCGCPKNVTTTKKGRYDVLVLSGGSVCGISFLGALHALHEREECAFDVYIGTSTGSMICYLLAIGYSPMEILTYICANNVFPSDLNLFTAIKDGTQYDRIGKHLEILTLKKLDREITLFELFNTRKVRLIVTTYNKTKDKITYLSHETHPSLPCLTAIRMSCNLPFVFSRYEHMDEEFIDGGFLDNFPVLFAGENFTESRILAIKMNTLQPEEEDDDNGKENNNSLIEYFYDLCCISSKELQRRNETKAKRYSNITTVSIPSLGIHPLAFSLDTTDKMNLFAEGFKTIKSYL